MYSLLSKPVADSLGSAFYLGCGGLLNGACSSAAAPGNNPDRNTAIQPTTQQFVVSDGYSVPYHLNYDARHTDTAAHYVSPTGISIPGGVPGTTPAVLKRKNSQSMSRASSFDYSSDATVDYGGSYYIDEPFPPLPQQCMAPYEAITNSSSEYYLSSSKRWCGDNSTSYQQPYLTESASYTSLNPQYTTALAFETAPPLPSQQIMERRPNAAASSVGKPPRPRRAPSLSSAAAPVYSIQSYQQHNVYTFDAPHPNGTTVWNNAAAAAAVYMVEDIDATTEPLLDGGHQTAFYLPVAAPVEETTDDGSEICCQESLLDVENFAHDDDGALHASMIDIVQQDGYYYGDVMNTWVVGKEVAAIDHQPPSPTAEVVVLDEEEDEEEEDILPRKNLLVQFTNTVVVADGIPVVDTTTTNEIAAALGAAHEDKNITAVIGRYLDVLRDILPNAAPLSYINLEHELDVANECLSQQKLPGGHHYIPVHVEDFMLPMALYMGIPPICVALGASYFQRLVAAHPALRDTAVSAEWFQAVDAYGGGVTTTTTNNKNVAGLVMRAMPGDSPKCRSLIKVYASCIYLAAKLADRVQYKSQLSTMLAVLLGREVSQCEAVHLEKLVLIGLDYRLGPLYNNELKKKKNNA